ncbi:chitooligosaccharidolytic beta-N-acetylglucosaminidase [Aphomia sociella]
MSTRRFLMLGLMKREYSQNEINRCVATKSNVSELNFRTLVDIINKYKNDICANDIDRAMLCTDDLEPFIKFKYPILRLRYFSEEKDVPKKLYLMISIVLYHCCTNSRSGMVDSDICMKMDKTEQDMILKFCEKLCEMEVTINNIDTAIKYSCTQPNKIQHQKQIIPKVTDRPAAGSYTLTSESYQSSDATVVSSEKRRSKKSSSLLKFKSAVTIMPSVIADESTYSKSPDVSDYILPYELSLNDDLVEDVTVYNMDNVRKARNIGKEVKFKEFGNVQEDSSELRRRCMPDCACTRCSPTGPCCGDPGSSMDQCKKEDNSKDCTLPVKENINIILPNTVWQCKDGFCQKVYQPVAATVFTSLSRCTLLCTGPQLWPYPIGYTYFSKTIVTLVTNKLEYKFQSVPSESVHYYLAEAFKLFLGDLARLERMGVKSKNYTADLHVKKMNIQIDIETDTDPRLRLNTEESYIVKVEMIHNQVLINIIGESFCGVRHGLETLSQLILLDQSTGHLITLSKSVIKDTPTYKYRGLMIDTARNYILVPDLMRTIDAMATVKLNTFHWRISDVTSFPLLLPKLPQLFEYGGYDRKLVYTKADVKSVVNRAGIRGIRVLLEVAAPGPVGRAWSWSEDVSCPRKNENFTCDNVLCLRLLTTNDVFDTLQTIYSEIIDMTKVDDIFHLSNGVFSLSNCYYLIEERAGFLDKALDRLKLANKGFLPKLPVIWYTTQLMKDYEVKTWDRLGVQLSHWESNPSDNFLSKFKVIHSSKWELSCEIRKQRCHKYRSWQEMYAWKSWKNIEVFTVEGGEAMLWTDMVDAGNLDYHLWPRLSAVAERLWSDLVANSTANGFVYVRLDSHRWRMLLRGVKVQPIWPLWCSFNPLSCIEKIK